MGSSNEDQELRDRLIRMETKLDIVAGTCPSCQARITALEVAQAEGTASAKSAHHRLDGIKSDVGLLVTVIGLVFTGLNYIMSHGVR